VECSGGNCDGGGDGGGGCGGGGNSSVVVVVVVVVVVAAVVIVVVECETIVLTYRARRTDLIRGRDIDLPLLQSVQTITGTHLTSYPLLIGDSPLPE